MTTVTAREFNHDVSAAKRDAVDGPVIITDRGRPSHVLLSFEEYQRLTGAAIDLVDWLRIDEDTDLETEPLQIGLKVPHL